MRFGSIFQNPVAYIYIYIYRGGGVRIVNVSSEIGSWTTGTMTAGAEIMKGTNIITVKVNNKMTP